MEINILNKIKYFFNIDISISEKELFENNKNSKFEENLYYMENKEKLDDFKRLGVLVTKIRDYSISKEEFLEYKDLLIKWTSIHLKEYSNMISKLDFTEDELINKIEKYSETNHNERMLIETFIGSVSGATMSAQINFIKDYKTKKNGKNKVK